MTLTLTVNEAGELVIPWEVLKMSGFDAGDILELKVVDRTLIIRALSEGEKESGVLFLCCYLKTGTSAHEVTRSRHEEAINFVFSSCGFVGENFQIASNTTLGHYQKEKRLDRLRNEILEERRDAYFKLAKMEG